MNVITRISSFIITELNRSGSVKDIKPDDSLVASGLLDSINILELIDFLEREFNIQIKMEDIAMENFDKLQTITKLLTSYGLVVNDD